MALSSLNGPSGWEHSVTSWLQERVKPYCDSVHTDVMGNLVAVQKCGNENAKKILLDAHIDEIGLIVTGIEKGFLRFASIGGVDARILPAMQVKVLTEPPIRGIIDSMPPHALSAEDMEKPFAMEKLTIDIAMTQEEAERDPRRNMLLQCIGASKTVKPDFVDGTVSENECYMLCSDGFRHMITEDEIKAAFAPSVNATEEQMKSNIIKLIELNKERNETDNISAILIKTV